MSENIFDEKNLIDERICSARQGRVLLTVDVSTGEILGNVDRVRTDSDVAFEKAMKDAYIKRKQIIKHNQLVKDGKSQFYMLRYIIGEMIDMGLSLANITRVIYLGTYMNYDNILVKGNQDKINKKDLRKILGLEVDAFRSFLKETSNHNVLKENQDGTFTINKHYFRRGKIRTKCDDYKFMYMRNLGIRELYEKSTVREHSRLAYLFMMIPFVHMKYNILCHNPLEEDFDKLELMSFKELGELFDVKNIKQLSHFLRMYQVNGKYLITQTITGNTRRIFVNPSLYSTGYCDVVTIHRIFESEDKKREYDVKALLGVPQDTE